jgi:hypothetical protein
MDYVKLKQFKPIFFVVFGLLGLILVIHGTVTGSDESGKRLASLQFETEVGGLGSCRFGAATMDPSQVNWLDDLGAGWYFSFTESMPSAPNAAEFVSLVSIRQMKTADGQYLPTYAVNPPMTDARLGQLVTSRPGSLWILGNEVDRGPNPGEIEGGQGDTFPDIYAEAYHEVYNFIKQKDPTAQVAVSALVEVTPGRLQYLDLMWQAYQDAYGAEMPVDVWNFHLYMLPEVKPNGQPNGVANVALGTDPALGRRESGGNPALCPQQNVYCVAEHDDISVFAEQIIAMRTWMKAHGQQNKPLILSEFSILYPYVVTNGDCWVKDENGNCFTPQRVTNFLNSSFNYLDTTTDPNLGYPKDGYRLVQQSLWFSIDNGNGVGNVSNLVRNNVLTQPGQAFVSYVQGLSTQINLYQDGVNNPVLDTGTGSTVNAVLKINIRNGGNVAPGNNFFVTFYKDAALSQPIGTATVAAPGTNSAGMTGCSRMMRVASVNWDNLPPGVHPFWVKIDSTNSIVETNESDNFGAGIVIVDGSQVFLPVTLD